ncbi:OmpA family protein [Jiulongibacter sp. NS-SX5]|uniref:OmpA family protein n=1 Tax=Jiulongibacter sp. NS-SX5 TaxID=3463854 RepID=UPI0040583096
MIVRSYSKTLVFLFGILLSFSTMAQQSMLKMAEHHYDNLSYVKAIEAYERALEKGPSAEEATRARIQLADSYCKIKDTQNAERVFRDIFAGGNEAAGVDNIVYLKYAQILASNGKYAESQDMYSVYNEKVKSDPRGQAFSKLYEDISVLSKNANCYTVDYLSINTTAADFSPSYYQNGLVFVSNRSNMAGVKRVFRWSETPFLDLFYLEDRGALGGSSASLGGSTPADNGSKRKRKKVGFVGADEYTAPTANDSRTIGSYGGTNINMGYGYGDKPITESEKFSGSINSKYHEGPAAFFKDGQRVIFTRNNFVKGKTGESSDGINKLKLYLATTEKDGWGNISELPFNSEEYSTGHPALNEDETLLFFASDMPGGYGGTDIYASRIEGGNWSQPINLGPAVNTKGNEMFPFVDENGNLYFSSEGLPGAGGLDIFFARMIETEIQGTPINLGMPINSSKDDFGMVTDGLRQNGYFSSNRKRGGDDDDIYSFERQCELQEGCDLILAVYDAETKMPLDNVTITYSDAAGELKEASTNSDGSLLLENLAENNEYTFRATREGYSANTVSFVTENCSNEPSRIEIPLSAPLDVAQNEDMDATLPDADGNLRGPGLEGPDGNMSESGYTNNSTCTISGKVLAQGTTNALSGVLVSLLNNCDGGTQTAYTDASGYFEFIAVEGCDYEISGAKEGLASNNVNISRLSCDDGGVSRNLYMFGMGDVVQVENIYFDYGKCNIRPDAQQGLDKLVKVMREYPGMQIELGSHTDSRSPADFNQRLSDGRAKESAEYLFKRGISRSRVTYKGYGESMITNGCVDGVPCSSAQHQANRRTEFKILQMN